jgi:hypothetical protein
MTLDELKALRNYDSIYGTSVRHAEFMTSINSKFDIDEVTEKLNSFDPFAVDSKHGCFVAYDSYYTILKSLKIIMRDEDVDISSWVKTLSERFKDLIECVTKQEYCYSV